MRGKPESNPYRESAEPEPETTKPVDPHAGARQWQRRVNEPGTYCKGGVDIPKHGGRVTILPSYAGNGFTVNDYTRRDLFAAAALQGLIVAAAQGGVGELSEAVVDGAWKAAELMLSREPK